MICFDISDNRFQLRAVAVIEHAGAVLFHRAVDDSFWALPGGRVELGERASSTIVREMKEELNENVECGQLLYVAENFFEYSGKRHHEIGLYFRARLATNSRLTAREAPFFGVEAHARVEFAWLQRSALSCLEIRPSFLRQSLSRAELTFEHVIERG